MSVTALVMAGGKATRMKMNNEKPLVEVAGRPLIEHVLNALRGVGKIDEIIVAVTRYTPKTATAARGYSVRVLVTPGRDWCSDVQYAVRQLQLGTVLTIAADLPLITCEVIEEIIHHYERCRKPALTVAVPLETCERLGLSVGYSFVCRGRRVVPTGIDVIDGKRIDDGMLEESVLVVDDTRVAVNVNSPNDIQVAESILQSSRV